MAGQTLYEMRLVVFGSGCAPPTRVIAETIAGQLACRRCGVHQPRLAYRSPII